jgi:hypothetical protein
MTDWFVPVAGSARPGLLFPGAPMAYPVGSKATFLVWGLNECYNF